MQTVQINFILPSALTAMACMVW